jgi:NAD(P)-dependent dehydrogenase (short-subunit alcohol dehydrogenase family)
VIAQRLCLTAYGCVCYKGSIGDTEGRRQRLVGRTSMDLSSKTAIVTGSARGIGRAIAQRFAAAGADVVINYVRSIDQAQSVAAEVQALGRQALVVQADVSQRTQVEAMLAQVLQTFGKIDILVSNAGIIIDKPFVESTDDDWHAAIETNLHGFFNCCRVVLPHMMERRSGRIIATGSIIVDTGNFGRNKYAVCTASKGGIVAMVKPLAVEAAPYGITVNAVSPGYIATDMMHEIDEAGREAVKRLIPAGRYGTPEEVAAAMTFLASDEAAYITGQVLRVNGGMVM